MLDPALWDDPDLAPLTPIERLLFVGLISLADDYGHVSAHPALLRKWIFGYDDITTEQVRTIRDHILVFCRNVELYVVANQEYLWLKTWERHQDLRFRARAQYPCHACGSYHTSVDFEGCVDKPVTTPTPTLTQSLRSPDVALAQSLRPDYVTLDQTTSCHEEVTCPAAPNGAETDSLQPPKRSKRPRQPNTELPTQAFRNFWQVYPRKKARTEAENAYGKVLKSGVTPETLYVGAANYASECALACREEQFTLLPATFLNKRRFEDYQKAPDPADFAPRVVGRKGVVVNGNPNRSSAEVVEPEPPDISSIKSKL